MKAIWKNEIVAESDTTLIVEDNHYFPFDSLNMKYFISSETTSHCPWKGDASYYSIVVNDDKNEDAAWYYQTPKSKAQEIKDHVAFWRGVEIVK